MINFSFFFIVIFKPVPLIGITDRQKGIRCIMAKYIVSTSSLNGRISVNGSKNSALPIMAASLMAETASELTNIPLLSDVLNMNRLMEHIGAEVTADKHRLTVSPNILKQDLSDFEQVTELRGSFLAAGALLGRTGRVRIRLPGGCRIGLRPVDLHLKGFSSLGAAVTQEHGCIYITADSLVGSKIYLDFPSVGATENLMMAASLAKGTTVIGNVAAEPEIIDLAEFINKMGGRITGAGTDTITVEGVSRLHGASHSIIPDRIEAGTFMTAAAITHGDVTIDKVVPSHLAPVTAKLREAGVTVDEAADSVRVRAESGFRATDIKTMPFPGFPTDMQAPFSVLMALSDGTGIITENIFENRFMHLTELKRMGANIKIEGSAAVIEGCPALTGAAVKATDLRASAALVLAGLAADGKTEIENIEYINRGYLDFDKRLRSLGANIEYLS